MKLKQLLTALFIGIATFSANAKAEESNKGKQPAEREQATSHAIDCDCQACVKQRESANAAPKNAGNKTEARVIDKGPNGKCSHGTPRGATCYRCSRGDNGLSSGSAATGPAKAPEAEVDKITPTKQGGKAEKGTDHRIPNPQKPADEKKKPAPAAEPSGGGVKLCPHGSNRCSCGGKAVQSETKTEESSSEKRAAPRDTYDDGPRVPIKKLFKDQR